LVEATRIPPVAMIAADNPMDGGLVVFVGTTPGDPGLCAARVTAQLAQADVVVADVGDAGPAQLVELARRGERVVRTVVGDPFDHAAVVEEMRALAEAGVSLEVVPGVGARQAAAAFAGVIGRAVRARASDVARIVEGEPPDRPVTLIASAGAPVQRVIVTTARKAPREASDLGDDSIVIAFGAPDAKLRWFERRPLFAKRILVTRAERQADSTATFLRERGADPVIMPAIEIIPPSDPLALARALSDLAGGTYSWVVFTSANGVEETWRGLIARGSDARAFGRACLAAIGPATARALETHGLRADVVAKEFRGEGLAAELLKVLASGDPGARILLPRALKARDILPRLLRDAGHPVDVVAAYETRVPALRDLTGLTDSLEHGQIDAVLFTSSSAVDSLCEGLGPRAGALLAHARVASIGPVTTETAAARGVRVDVTAREYTLFGLVRALEESYGRAEL
jgi:uroporphyrinogen III methyltransferase/synthase